LTSFTIYNVVVGQKVTSPETGEEYVVEITAESLTILEEKYVTVSISFPCGNHSYTRGLDYQLISVYTTTEGKVTKKTNKIKKPPVHVFEEEIPKEAETDGEGSGGSVTFDEIEIPLVTPITKDEGTINTLRVDSFMYSIKLGQIIPPGLDAHSEYQQRMKQGDDTVILDSLFTQGLLNMSQYDLVNTGSNMTSPGMVENLGMYPGSFYQDSGNRQYYSSRVTSEVELSDLKSWYTVAKLLGDDAAEKSIKKILDDNKVNLDNDGPSYVEPELSPEEFLDTFGFEM
jgi:hypothetical protein